jgi:hypothetical protein
MLADTDHQQSVDTMDVFDDEPPARVNASAVASSTTPTLWRHVLKGLLSRDIDGKLCLQAGLAYLLLAFCVVESSVATFIIFGSLNFKGQCCWAASTVWICSQPMISRQVLGLTKPGGLVEKLLNRNGKANSHGRPDEYVSSEQVYTSVLRLLFQRHFINVYTFGSSWEILTDTVLLKVYIVVLCVRNFIAGKLNVRQKPIVFGNASETAIGAVGVHTIDFGPLGVFHAMA